MTAYQQPEEAVRHELEQSRLFYESAGKHGKRAYFSYERYCNLDLAKAILIDATLQEADFRGACLDEAFLIRALANGLQLELASLFKCNFDRAEMSEANLMSAQGRKASFRRTDLARAQLNRGDFCEASFVHARCVRASFRAANLERADFTDAILIGTNFTDAKLMGAVFNNARFGPQPVFQNAEHLNTIVADRIYVEDRLFEGPHIFDILRTL